MKTSALTSPDNFFEDFSVGQVIRHARGKTIEGLENVLITNMVMNTAQAHFNEHAMADRGGRLVFGGVTLSVTFGLAMQDCGENAVAELGMDNIRLTKGVHHGDSLYAYSEVLAVADGTAPDIGEVTFRHYGVNQDDALVCTGERRMAIKRRSHWASK